MATLQDAPGTLPTTDSTTQIDITDASTSVTLDLAAQPDPTGDPLGGPGLGSMNLAALLAESARARPDHVAVICLGQQVTYAELWASTRAYAGALAARGIGRGDRVAVVIPNVPDFPRVYFAVLSLGAVVVPVHLLFTSEEMEHVLRDSGAKLVVGAAPVLASVLPAAGGARIPAVTVMVPDEALSRVPAPRLEDEAAAATPIERYLSVNPLAPATILYTSGTTGYPKGAVGSHFAILEQVNCALLDSFPLLPDDVVFGGLPLFHTFGQVCVMNVAFRRGATVVLLPRFEPSEALSLMVEHQATVFTAVPTMYIGLLHAAASSPARPPLRFGISGGASLPVAVLESFESTFGAAVHEGYGLTETSPAITFNRVGEPTRPGTVGRPLWGVDIEIADPTVPDAIVMMPTGELGEIVCRGHALFKGYLGNPAATAEAVVDGWFRTGDIGVKDADGIVSIKDRTKDMIIRNGYNVYSSEVENALMRFAGVSAAAVFGVPDSVHGQEVHAAVILEDGSSATEDEIISFMRDRVAAFKYPRAVHVRDALPTGPSGKVLKRELVAEYSKESREASRR